MRGLLIEKKTARPAIRGRPSQCGPAAYFVAGVTSSELFMFLGHVLATPQHASSKDDRGP